MRMGVCLMAIAIGGCSGRVEQSVAQCQLEASGPTGTSFRKQYAGEGYKPVRYDDAYREFVLICMKAKGYDFKTPNFEHTDREHCWAKDEKGNILATAFTDIPSCYSRDW